MTNINDLLTDTSDQKTNSGGFTGFVIGVFEGIQGLVFAAIWIAAGSPFLLGGLALGSRQDDAALSVIVGTILGIVVGFVVAVTVTGFAEVFIDMRRQLVAIRKRLDERP